MHAENLDLTKLKPFLFTLSTEQGVGEETYRFHFLYNAYTLSFNKNNDRTEILRIIEELRILLGDEAPANYAIYAQRGPSWYFDLRQEHETKLSIEYGQMVVDDTINGCYTLELSMNKQAAAIFKSAYEDRILTLLSEQG